MRRTMSRSEWEHWFDNEEPATGVEIVYQGRRYHVVSVTRDRIALED